MQIVCPIYGSILEINASEYTVSIKNKNGGSKTQGISLKHTEKCVQYKLSNRDQKAISTCWVSNKTKVIVQYLQKYNLRQEDLKRKKTKLFN